MYAGEGRAEDTSGARSGLHTRFTIESNQKCQGNIKETVKFHHILSPE